jgi:hypothetical protein
MESLVIIEASRLPKVIVNELHIANNAPPEYEVRVLLVDLMASLAFVIEPRPSSSYIYAVAQYVPMELPLEIRLMLNWHLSARAPIFIIFNN